MRVLQRFRVQASRTPVLAMGVGAGTATITVAFNGKSGSSSLTVTGPTGNGTKIPLMEHDTIRELFDFPGRAYMKTAAEHGFPQTITRQA